MCVKPKNISQKFATENNSIFPVYSNHQVTRMEVRFALKNSSDC